MNAATKLKTEDMIAINTLTTARTVDGCCNTSLIGHPVIDPSHPPIIPTSVSITIPTDLDQHPTGAVRSADLSGKRYDLIPHSFIRDYLVKTQIYGVQKCLNECISKTSFIQNCIIFIYEFLCYTETGPGRDASLLCAANNLTSYIKQRDSLSFWEAAQHRFLEGVAHAFHEGTLPHKYGANNWLLGFPIEDVLNHAIEHLLKYNSGDRSEDHIGHASWNICAAYHYYATQRVELLGGLLGENYMLTDEIKKRLQEHASRKRLILQNKESTNAVAP